jgi:hypothetical protein
MKNAYSSNSEDALTWSCFDTLTNVSQTRRALALEELWELAYGDMAVRVSNQRTVGAAV